MNTELASFFEGMTNHELAELYIGMQSNLTEMMAVYISVLFAYLAVAFLVGNKLNSFQLYTISIIYSFFSLNAIWSIAQVGRAQIQLTNFGNGFDSAISEVQFFGNILLLIAVWVASLVFMKQTRNAV